MSDFLQAARNTDPNDPLPHQDAAWAYAWDLLSADERAEFLSIFRAAVPSRTRDVSADWAGVLNAAAAAGSKYPELVAAQAALESAWFKKPSGRNNYWGLKGEGTKKRTVEVIDGKTVEIEAEFKDFPNVRAGVTYLVDRWYKDYSASDGRVYRGVNNAPDREEAAAELVRQGYATDPGYARKLVELMNQHAPRPRPTQQSVKAEAGVWRTKVRALNLSQPDASTCQAACLGMAVGDRDIASIRRRLSRKGVPGDPAVMGAIAREYGNVDYAYDGNASLSQVATWLRAGELLVTHGWFTRSGHVIVLDGLAKKPDGSIAFDVKDPWSEFDAPSWSYKSSSKFYDGYYSDRLIYAACVAGASATDARRLYQSGALDLKRSGMWVHRFKG